MRAAIVAGGLGTRMAPLGDARPKPLLPVGGRALLLRQLDLLAREGCAAVTVHTGHRAQAVEDALRADAPAGLELGFAPDPFPAGSGGCLAHGPGPGEEPLLVLFGDVMLDMDLGALLAFHRARRAALTAVAHPNRHPHDSDLVELRPDGRVLALHRKPHPPGLALRNMATAGAFVLSPSLLRAIPTDRPSDLVQDLMAGALARGERVFGYHSTEYLKDMGTPHRYEQVQRDWERGLIGAMHRSRPRPVAFLDRDGTLNRERGHLSRPEQLELLPGAGAAVRALNEAGVLAVLTTNQPVLARGETDAAGLAAIHARLEALLGREGAFLDALLHCPHHPDAGVPGEVPELKGPCACRKPGTGMIERARALLPVDLGRAMVFGDSHRDLGMARAAGLPCALIGPGLGVPADDPSPRFPSLEAAVQRWLTLLSSPPEAP